MADEESFSGICGYLGRDDVHRADLVGCKVKEGELNGRPGQVCDA